MVAKLLEFKRTRMPTLNKMKMTPIATKRSLRQLYNVDLSQPSLFFKPAVKKASKHQVQ